ncbi:MAPEG family protein [Aestuariicella hydrocarbonica]|uniref:MAPEG family protein n=1 Tax=Pseudomaricurvus hydrocarbonicus TaxID=1470433 RepID=A0A9E5MKW4_9GAMM|nr:MAPEG family protein [Aestuariicella hydrocarbonica]NHO65947.1 MAPEG family protein [Aestuariicella hydrocarbonica]
MMAISLICVALLAFLCIALGFNVSMARAKSRQVYGYETDPESRMYKAQRAHGNTIEYAPVLILLIYILGQSPQPAWVIVTMVLATFFRYLLVAGLLLPKTMAKPNPMRFVGALGTYITGFVLVVATLMLALKML